jgi:hypothetical protein
MLPKTDRENLTRTLGLVTAIILIAGIILTSRRQITTARQTNSDGLTGEMRAGRHFGQTFRAPFSALYRIDVVLSNYARQNHGRIVFHLYDNTTQTKITTIDMDATQIRDNAPQRFTFDPIPGSANREFYFYLEAPEAVSGNGIAVHKTSYDSYSNGQAYIDDQPTAQDLRFVAHYHSNPREAWRALIEQIRSRHPHLWQLRWPAVSVTLAFVLGIGALLGEVMIAGGQALSRRTMLLLVAVALTRGLVYVATIPPWESPDEYGHFEYAWLISEAGPFAGPEAIPPEFQQRMLALTGQHDYWRQIEDPPLYYVLVGSVLRLVGHRDPVTGLYVGRIVSAILCVTTVGLTALTTRHLFSRSRFMQVTPVAFILFLPMFGEIGTSISNGAIGVLSSTFFFASLVPIFRDGLTWRRAGCTTAALILALLSNKTTLFLIPTALLALPIYQWVRGVTLSRRAKIALTTSMVTLVITGTALTLSPGGDASRWIEKTSSCEATRVEDEAYAGKAAIRIGQCADEIVTQALPQDVVNQIVGQRITLSGQVRAERGQAVGQVTIWDSEESTMTEIPVKETWLPFTLTHVVNADARHAAVRLSWIDGEAVLFDDLSLSLDGETNLLVNGSAEEKESLLLEILTNVGSRLWSPLRRLERLFMPTTWNLPAWQTYLKQALFCFHSFWGNFGWLALPLPPTWYWALELLCMLALMGNIRLIAQRPSRTWQTGYYILLMTSFGLLMIQTFLPIAINKDTLWLAQGRYLFPCLFAIAILGMRGIHQLLPKNWDHQATAVTIGLMAGFDLMCLVYLIVPYFYR